MHAYNYKLISVLSSVTTQEIDGMMFEALLNRLIDFKINEIVFKDKKSLKISKNRTQC